MVYKHRKNIRPSMLIEGFRFISIYYFSIAILVTITQLYIELDLSRQTIFKSIDRLHTSFEASLTNALWEFNESQVETILKGILESPYVTGVRLIDPSNNHSSMMGEIPTDRQLHLSGNWLEKKFSPEHKYQFKFKLLKEFEQDKLENVGELTIFSGNDLLFDQLKRTLYFVIVTSFLKTTILWIILWLFFKSKFKEPISLLINKIQGINPHDPTTIESDKSYYTQEIYQIINSFNSLSLEVKNYKDILEALLQNKTELLKEKSKKVRELVDKLEDAQNQIINQEKLNSLGLVSAGIAHELKNPLNLSKNAALILQERWQDYLSQEENIDPTKEESHGQVTNLIDILNNNNNRMETVIRSMLLQSRYDNSELIPIELNSFIDVNFNAVLKSLKTESSRKCKVDLNIPDNIEIKVFPNELGRLLVNIYENAFYAIDEKHRRMADENKEYIPEIKTFIGQENEDRVSLHIYDNGTGIPESIKNKVLEPFFTTKPTGQGTGLGLYLGYEIVKKHKGNMRINSQEGKYTEFIINLPKN